MNHRVLFLLNFLPRLYLPLLIFLCAVLAWRPLEGGFDFWAHAAVGKWIWTNARPPSETLFIWSEPHTPWVAHSWLSELFFYGLLSQGGPAAVVVFTVLMAMSVFLLLWNIWKKHAPQNCCVPLLFALTIWVSAPRFQPRQELISALFLMFLFLFLIALQTGRFDERLRTRGVFGNWILLIPISLLFALWVNLHALVAVGLLTIVVTIGADSAQLWFQRMFQRKDLPQCKDLPQPEKYFCHQKKRLFFLLAAGVLCAGATLLNPYGIGYWSAANQLKSGSQAEYIQEWKALWVAPAMLEYAFVELLLCFFAVAAWLSNPERRWSHFSWTLLMALLLLRSRRMLWLAAIVFVLVLALNAHALGRWNWWERWRRLTRGQQDEPIPMGLRVMARSGAVLALLVWGAASFYHLMKIGRIEKGVYVQNVPAGAADFIRRTSGVKRIGAKRIFNDYEDGSYLQWRLNGAPSGSIPASGRQPLYIDMLNAYPDSLLFEYFDILAANPRGVRKLSERKIDLVVLGDHRWEKPLARYLDEQNQQWQLVFHDSQSKIWMKTARLGPS